MILKKIKFAQDDDECPMPSEVTVTMTIQEALWIANIAGSTIGSPETASNIYSCLVGEVVNRYWDDGLRSACGNEIKLPTFPKAE